MLIVLHCVTSSKFGDVTIDDMYTFEIGGPSKTREQIRGVPNAYIAADDINFSCVLSFPHGADTPEVKAFQAQNAIENGVDEIDMVINIGKFDFVQLSTLYRIVEIGFGKRVNLTIG